MTVRTAEGLTPEQLTFFNENGYLLIPDALSQDTVKQLLEDTNNMLNYFSLDDHPMTKFSTGGDDGADVRPGLIGGLVLLGARPGLGIGQCEHAQ